MAWFSNYGTCVDIWGPGLYIYSSIANNDTAYAIYSGTTMASPAVAGTVANLLWVDLTLTFQQIQTILKSDTITIDGYVCDSKYDCQQFIYDCDTLPTEYYSTFIPSTTADPSSFVVYDGVDDYDCNYLAIATIDRSREDTSNHNDYFIGATNFYVTDKCISSQESSTSFYSDVIECVEDNVADFYAYETRDCSGDGTFVRRFTSGQIIGDYWFIVDCNSDNINGTQYSYTFSCTDTSVDASFFSAPTCSGTFLVN